MRKTRNTNTIASGNDASRPGGGECRTPSGDAGGCLSRLRRVLAVPPEAGGLLRCTYFTTERAGCLKARERNLRANVPKGSLTA